MSETSRSLHDRIEKARQAGAAYAAATTPQQAAQATATINALLAAPPITATITTKARTTEWPSTVQPAVGQSPKCAQRFPQGGHLHQQVIGRQC